jgi:hypothetical protein
MKGKHLFGLLYILFAVYSWYETIVRAKIHQDINLLILIGLVSSVGVAFVLIALYFKAYWDHNIFKKVDLPEIKKPVYLAEYSQDKFYVDCIEVVDSSEDSVLYKFTRINGKPIEDPLLHKMDLDYFDKTYTPLKFDINDKRIKN